MEPVLSLSNISYRYHTLLGETQALKDICLTIFPGEFIAIVGPSGCGKSTLLHLIAGLLKPSDGELAFYHTDGSATASKLPPSFSPFQIGYMLQRDHLLEHRTIFKNICLGLEIQKKMTPERILHIESMLEEYGLAGFQDAYPRQLSGGMRQRAALIRTLALSPNLLLLDEPFSALDYQTRLSVSNDIGTIIKQQKITAILVTHDLSEAISLADRVVILSKRPGTVKDIVPIRFAAPPLSPEDARNKEEFKEYFNHIWKEIKHED